MIGLDGEVFALDRAMHFNLVETRRHDGINTNDADAETNTGFLLYISGWDVTSKESHEARRLSDRFVAFKVHW